MSFPILPRQKLVMIGDSITDADRVKPIGEGLFNPLGTGYVTFVDAILTAFMPAAGVLAQFAARHFGRGVLRADEADPAAPVDRAVLQDRRAGIGDLHADAKVVQDPAALEVRIGVVRPPVPR